MPIYMLQNKGNSCMLTIMFIFFEIIHFYIYSFVFWLVYFFILMCLFFWLFVFSSSLVWDANNLMVEFSHCFQTCNIRKTHLWQQHSSKKVKKWSPPKQAKKWVSMLIFADCMHRTGATEPSSLLPWGYWLLWQINYRHIHGTATFRGYHPSIPG